MHYEINVSLNGKHFFATAERSLRTQLAAEVVYEELCNRFPAEEGFAVVCTERRSVGATLRARPSRN